MGQPMRCPDSLVLVHMAYHPQQAGRPPYVIEKQFLREAAHVPLSCVTNNPQQFSFTIITIVVHYSNSPSAGPSGVDL